MSDWGGPYIAVMLTTDDQGESPIVPVITDAGRVQTIRGIGTEAVIPRLGWTVSLRLLIVMFPGRMASGQLNISMVVPDGSIHVFPKAPFTADEDPVDVIQMTIPIQIECRSAGVYWFRAQVGGRMLSRIPFRISLLPDIPEAFLKM